LIRGRGISYIREASPPFDSPLKGRGKNIRREASPLFNSPLVSITLKGGRDFREGR